MIRQKLLKVAHAATTAVPTYIYRGKRDRLTVVVTDINGTKYDLSSEDGARQFEAAFGIRLPQQIDERISLLTADRELSLMVKEVCVELAEDGIAKDLCIIDTPGINPGADYARHHADITKSILNEKADAMIVLFPADQAYTQSFEKFLKDNAEYFMRDAIFVVTMLDRVDEEERDDVIRFVQTNLRNNFHLQNPQVLSCSAMRNGKDPYWTEKFREFEQQLMDRLAKNRHRIVTQRLIKLSQELLSSVQDEIFAQRTEFESRLAVLKNHSVPNLMAVLASCKRTTEDELISIRREHDATIRNERNQLPQIIMQAVNAGLNRCSSRSEVTNYVNNSLAKDIEDACTRICAISNGCISRLNSVLSLGICQMIETLKVYYGEIGSALPERTASSASEQQMAIGDKLTGLSGMIVDFGNKLDVATALGGAGLAAIILTGLGPVGWVIGGFAALIGGDRLFVGTARDKVRDAVQQKLPSITQPVVQGLINAMQTNYHNACLELDSRKKALIDQYEPIYKELESQLRLQKQQLASQIQNNEHTQRTIQTVLQQLSDIQGGIVR